jgi:hypothetical protein
MILDQACTDNGWVWVRVLVVISVHSRVWARVARFLRTSVDREGLGELSTLCPMKSGSSASAARRTSSTPRRCSGCSPRTASSRSHTRTTASAAPTPSSSTPAASSKQQGRIARRHQGGDPREGARKVKRVVVAGCLVQRHRAKMLEWAPGIDAMVGVFDRDKIVEAVRGARPKARDAPAPARPSTGSPATRSPPPRSAA